MSEVREFTVITGASKGIGKGIAIKFAQEGHDLALFGRNKKDLENVKKEVEKFDSKAEIYIGDVTNVDFVNNSIKEILQKHGKIDHLINNAGIGVLKKFVDTNFSEFQKVIDTNLFGVYHFTKAVVDSMIEKQKGSIINISSLAGKNNFVGGTLYSASKHALQGFTKSLMLELREYNIRVAAVCPGSVNTDFSFSNEPKSRTNILQIEDVADVVYSIIKLHPRALMSEVDLRPTRP